MAKDLLLEIGLEEMPAHVVTPSRKQLEKKVIDFLEDQALDYETIESFSTPRRLSVKVSQLIEEQADVEEEVKGPAKKIALDADGNWTKAAEGFVRGQGLSTNDIYFKEIKGVDYVHLIKYVKGEATKEVVKGMKKIIEGMTFPVSMHWSSYHFKYIRPIHWLVFLFGEEVIPISILDVKAGNQARGHRFLGDPVTLISAKDYQTEMAKQFVIVQPEERKNKIVAQAKQLAETNDWQLDLDEDLLEEVTNLVEYPTAFAGNFDEKYLSLPEEVLITSMKEHQRYFEVRSQNGELLPFFISVRNGDAVHLDNVIKGNEKVLTARLEDAEFFYKEDQKLSIEDCVNKLKQVTFHEKIGTVYEKMQRVAGICQLIGQELNFTEEELNDLKRASEIYKFDLVTNMVGEFPELQGIMGEKYALIQGENPFVSQAVREHYLPNSSDGKLPQSKVGSVLAIADKLDSLVTFFAAEMIPSGSNDPYALRRQAYGIIRIIENNQWNFPIRQLYKKIMETIDFSSVKSVNNLKEKREEILSFIKARVKQRLLSENFRHDLVEAVTESSQENIAAIFEISKVLATHQADDNFKETIEALTRTIQLAKKNPEVLAEEESNVVNPDLFENQAEKELYDQVEAISQAFDSNSSEENYLALCSLRPAIADYFDQTMVMSDNIEIRNNRLKQLGKIAKLAQSFAQLEHLIIK